MIEYWIFGCTKDMLVTLPVEHGMTTYCAQHIIDDYFEKHPEVVCVTLTVIERDHDGTVQD